MITEERAPEVPTYYKPTQEPFLRITVVDSSERFRVYLSKTAYDKLGRPEYVRFMLSKANGQYRIKMVPSQRGLSNTRRIRAKNSQTVTMSGGANLVKKYGFLPGYYILDDDLVFTWRYANGKATNSA